MLLSSKTNFIVRGGGDFSGLYKEFDKAQKKTATFQAGISKSFKAVGAALAALGIGKLGKDFLMTAADTEMLNVAMQSVGKASGYAADAIEQHKLAVMSMGIAEQEATHIMTRFMQAQLDTAEASKLARVAQDAAVIAGVNSSDAAEQMTEAIAKQRPMLLSQFGMTANLTDINQRYADTLGITVASMSSAQKQQAMLNYILSEGDKIAGTYEASMGTVGKQIGSLSRYWQTFKNTVATPFLPILAQTIDLVTQSLINATAWFQRHTATLTKWANTITAIIALFRKIPDTTKAQTSAAKSNTAAIVKQGKAIADTGKAANKAALGIDEFHSISQDDTGGATEIDMGLDAVSGADLAMPEIDTSGVAEATEVFDGLYNVFVKMKTATDTVKNKLTEFRIALGITDEVAKKIKDTFGKFIGVLALATAGMLVLWGVGKLITVAITGMQIAFALLTSPIGLTTLAIGTLIFAVWQLIEHWDEVKEAAINSWNYIVEGWQLAGEWFNSTVTEPIKEFFNDLYTNIKEFFTNSWNYIVDGWQGASGWFTSTVTDPITNAFSKLYQGITNTFAKLGNWFRTNVSEPIASGFKGAINVIISAINRFISGINRIRISIPDWAAKLAGMSAGASIGFNIPTITPLAKGGIVTEPTFAMVGEAGPEAVIPLDKGQKYLQSDEQEATFNITVELDGDVIYKKMQRIKNDRGLDFGMGVFAR